MIFHQVQNASPARTHYFFSQLMHARYKETGWQVRKSGVSQLAQEATDFPYLIVLSFASAQAHQTAPGAEHRGAQLHRRHGLGGGAVARGHVPGVQERQGDGGSRA